MGDPGRRNGICVLTFHRVVGVCERDHDITWQSFRGLLDVVVRSGKPNETHLASDETLQKASVALTFDDGTADHLQVGRELAKRGIVGIFFVPPGKVGIPGRLGFHEVRELQALGHILGSHGFSHVQLRNGMTRPQIRRELADSKAVLEDALGSRVLYFAPPGGFGPRWLSAEIETFGYHASRSMVWGIYRSLRKRWTIPCVPVTEYTLARGWVRAAVSTHALPFSMRSAWVAKSLAPRAVLDAMRTILHQPFRIRAECSANERRGGDLRVDAEMEETSTT